MITFASVRDRNHSRLRHSSRNLPLKLSVTPFCQGLPGSINAVPMPCVTIQDNSALDTNSGPLSLRRNAGAPRGGIGVRVELVAVALRWPWEDGPSAEVQPGGQALWR